MASTRRYLLLGSGVAGIAAAQAIRRADPSAEICIVTEDPFGYYSRPGLAYYLTGEIGEDALFPFSKKELKAFNLRWIQTQALRIDAPEHRVALATRDVLTYDRLLIATGSQATGLTVAGKDLEGVLKLDHLGDAKAILQHARRGRRAVVVGGGITALELAEGLRARGMEVHYLLRGTRYWGNVLDETESQIVQTRLEQEGIVIHYNTELAEILGKNNKVTGVTIKDGKTIPCDLVAFAIGVVARKELAQAAGLKTDRGILVDEYLKTSHPDIFAAGDVAQVFDPLTGRTTLDTLWPTAREEGQIAGENMAGGNQYFHKSTPLNVTRLAGLTTTIIGMVGQSKDTTSIGINRGDSETWQHRPDATVAETRFESNRLRLLVGPCQISGALIMGDQKLSRITQELIENRADITPIRDTLLHSKRISEVIAAFYQQWRPLYAQPRS